MLQPAAIVKSRAGRDKEKWFAVLSVEGDFALIADGKSRPLERPKRKRVKHLAPTGRLLEAKRLATNRSLRKALSEFAARDVSKEVSDLGKG